MVVAALAGAALAIPLALVALPAAAVEPVVVTPASAGQYSETGTWATARASGYSGTPERFSREPGATATWTATAPAAATYDIAVYYAASVDNAPAEYNWTSGPDTPTVVNQASAGNAWRTIGSAFLDTDQAFSMTVTATAGDAVTDPTKNVITRANAVRLTPRTEGGGEPDGECGVIASAAPALDAPAQVFPGYTLTQAGTTTRIEASDWAMSVDRTGFRYALESAGAVAAAAHPTAGLQLAGDDAEMCDAVSATLASADQHAVTFTVTFSDGRTATATVVPSADSVNLAVSADDGVHGKIRAQVAGGLNPAYGLGDLAGHRSNLNAYGVKNLDYYAQLGSGTTNQRFVSNFTIFPNRGFGQVDLSDERLAIQVDAAATLLGVDGASMPELHYFFGDPATIYARYAEVRRGAGYLDAKPDYTFFGVGYESYGALGYNTNQATITNSVTQYLEKGYPLEWAVTGSGFWPYGSGSAQGTTSSFGLWGSKYPQPDAYKQFFQDNGVALILGARQSFRALPSDGGAYDPALDGDGTQIGIDRGYFILDADGTPKVFTPVSFPNTAMYLIDPDDAEAVAWFAERSAEWGVDGYKEDHMFNGTANGYVNNALVNPINEALDASGALTMVRNSAFSVGGSILRLNDTDYNHGGADRDRTVVNGLAYAASGQPNFYPDIVGGRIITDLETNTAKQKFLARNAMMAAMSPSMSFGNEPWRMNDPELVAATLKAAQWHGTFQPYIYSAAISSWESGYPATATPLPIAFPSDAATYDLVSYAAKQYEWMLGSSLLVAPLYGSDTETAMSRDVYLPAGQWQDIETGERFVGPTTLEAYPQPFGKIPAFVGGAGILVTRTGEGEALQASVHPVASGEDFVYTASDGETKSTISARNTVWAKDELVVRDESGADVSFTVDETTGAVVFGIEPGVDYVLADADVEPPLPADDELKAPGVGVLSSTSGWAHGLHDGEFELRMNLWWGANASRIKFYENGILIHTQDLTAAGPAPQSVTVPISGRHDGEYVYTAELINSKGTTATAPLTVTVRDAKPAVPVLSHDNRDGDGTYAVTANLWWGTNATSWALREDGAIIASGALEAKTPAAQQAVVVVSGRSPGARTYIVEFSNAAGTTASAPLKVTVKE
ncbi:golvesin C-terminal-like domain-containing protein [Microbacterium allomyrinae]|uniref:DUF5110 domain-containing protein n=1 Tax=Microbacterium allomyrinae TaxID=2830666 RepID=A0A9X1LVC0_9MICO|nr:TIM-barrel domain-containing protein [Microbacterium allomyrinae]MCC2032764.1 hypothetical protein [Microbacterium allomyrinae]